MEYDQNGRITSQIFADGKSWSYTYLEKVCIVVVMMIRWFILLHSHGYRQTPPGQSKTNSQDWQEGKTTTLVTICCSGDVVLDPQQSKFVSLMGSFPYVDRIKV